MPEEKKDKNGQIGEEDLDALLARWAEAEIEPPADLHAQTMARLRVEAQPKKPNKVVSIFLKKKKWMSVAAAAVLVLCCIPVVQAQFGGNMANPVYDMAASQQAESADSEAAAQTTENVTATAKQTPVAEANTQNIDQNEARKTERKAVNDTVAPADTPDTASSNAAITVPDVSSDQSGNRSGSADFSEKSQEPAVGSQAPAIAMFSLEHSEDSAVQNDAKVRSITEDLDDLQAKAQSYQQALEELQQQLQDAEKKLKEYDEKLQAEPDNPELPDQIKELQDTIDTLKKEIKELQALVAETSTQQ